MLTVEFCDNTSLSCFLAFPASLPHFPESVFSHHLLNKQPLLLSLPQGLFPGEPKSTQAILYFFSVPVSASSIWLVLVGLKKVSEIFFSLFGNPFQNAQESLCFFLNPSARFSNLHFPRTRTCLKEIYMSQTPSSLWRSHTAHRKLLNSGKAVYTIYVSNTVCTLSH